RHLLQVAGHDPVDQARGVLPGQPVLEERRDVDHGRRVADRGVLVVVVRLVGADRGVPGTLAVVQALAEGKRALVYGGPDRHWILASSPLPPPERGVTRELVGARDYKYARALAA